jgi:hypothetical protein
VPYIDAGPARAHIHLLLEHGIGYNQIAKLAGTSASHVRQLACTSLRIRPETAARILAVAAVDANRAQHRRIDATGTRRRLQALVATGWAPAALGRQLDRSASNLRRILTTQAVSSRTAREVDDLYERLWNTRPAQDTPARQRRADAARAEARAAGWPPPLAWDDIDSDPDPPALPGSANPHDIDEIAVDRAVAGDGIRLAQLTPAEQTEAVRRLTERGKSIRDIAEQLRTTKRTVSRRRAGAAARAA